MSGVLAQSAHSPQNVRVEPSASPPLWRVGFTHPTHPFCYPAAGHSAPHPTGTTINPSTLFPHSFSLPRTKTTAVIAHKPDTNSPYHFFLIRLFQLHHLVHGLLCAASPACSICITCCLLAAPTASAVSPGITAAHAPRRLRQVVCFIIYLRRLLKTKTAKVYSAWARADCAGEKTYFAIHPHACLARHPRKNQSVNTLRNHGYFCNRSWCGIDTPSHICEHRGAA